jgi:glycosyltransferase involved in cell wall biosynthesis
VRICLVYDCLFPHTVGGAERWYANLAKRLTEDGHDVTYLTLRQWEDAPGLEGVRVVAVGPGMELYTHGRRRVLPPLVFGLGVLVHLLARGRRYDVVHTGSFPYFSLLAAALARPLHRFSLVVDWHEVWTAGYWHEYLGRVRGRIGWLVQWLCLRVPQRAFCFSRLYADRLREWRVNGELSILEGEFDGPARPADPKSAEPVVVFAGRHIPEKRAPDVIPAVAKAREQVPELRCIVFGDGPDHHEVLRRVEQYGVADAVEVPGFVSPERVESALATALCLLLPSRREGYGLVVVEAAAEGTPSVVVRGPDNAATELIEHGVNGFIAESGAPDDLAAAIVAAHQGGLGLRRSTANWFGQNADRLSLRRSLETVSRAYSARSLNGGRVPPS